MKLAVLDRLRRVILVSGYSKMLAASLRVGYVAAHPDILQKLADLKMLAGLTSPELGERVIHRVLMEGQYRRHAERVRARVDEARRRCVQGLTALGLTVPREPHAGMFVWADCGRDSGCWRAGGRPGACCWRRARCSRRRRRRPPWCVFRHDGGSQ